MESSIGLLILLVLLVLIGGPILAIVAFVRVGNLQKAAEQVPRLTARIYDLEQRLEALDRKLRSQAAPAPAEEVPETPPRPAAAPVVIHKVSMADLMKAPTVIPKTIAKIKEQPQVASTGVVGGVAGGVPGGQMGGVLGGIIGGVWAKRVCGIRAGVRGPTPRTT